MRRHRCERPPTIEELSTPAVPCFRDGDRRDRETNQREQDELSGVRKIEQVVQQPDSARIEPMPRMRERLRRVNEREGDSRRNIQTDQTTKSHARVFNPDDPEVKLARRDGDRGRWVG